MKHIPTKGKSWLIYSTFVSPIVVPLAYVFLWAYVIFKAASNGLKEFWKELKYQTDREHIGYFRWLVKFKNKYKEEWKKAFVSLQIFNDIFTFYLQKNPIRHGSSCWIQTIQFLVFNRAAIYQRDNER